MRITSLFLLAFFSFFQLTAQISTIPPVGPKALGMGGVSVMNADHWSVLNNPAGLATAQDISGFVSYRSIFDFSPFNTVSAGALIPAGFGNLGVGVFRFGDDLFNTQMFSVAASRKIGIMALGIKASYLQLNIDGFGSKGVFVADIGGVADLTPELTFGAHIYNFTQSAISAETNERVPTVIRLGLAYQPTNEFTFVIEGEKDVNLDPDLKLGIQYQLIEKVHLRTGFSGLNNSHSFGGGLELKKFVIDYGVSVDRDLGSTHNFGISFHPSK